MFTEHILGLLIKNKKNDILIDMRGFLSKNQRQKQIISRLKNENKKLRDENKNLKEEVKTIKLQLEQALLSIEELQRIIFGKKKRKDDDDNNPDKMELPDSRPPKRRPSSSYRRTIPKEDEITDYEDCHIDNCPGCGSQLTDFKIVVRYIEDILPLSEWFRALKRVTKKHITTGYCSHCRKRVSAEELRKQTVSIGENVGQFVVFTNIILRLSCSQIVDFLSGTIRFNISKGEIVNILERQAGKLRPEFERLRRGIRGQPGVHMDETSWKVQTDSKAGGNYAWVMAGTQNTDTVFMLGKNRGKGNAEELLGKDNEQVGISDDYGAYKNLFFKHALCWAHPHRKLRDLKDSGNLDADKKEHCKTVYSAFAGLYAKVKETTEKPFVRKNRQRDKRQLMAEFEKIIIPHENEPVKLRKIKERLAEQKECYFTCITEPGIPADNNKAERSLRHLVLKRKNCYGSKTDKGAEIGSILYSVLLSTWWRDKQNFFQNFEKLAI